MMSEPPGVSIVITVYNNASSISELLDSLLLQEGPIEIVVVDSMSTDGTSDILARYAGENKEISYFRIRCSRGGGRNIGVSKARYDFVAFTDGDAIADP
ncbi:MAG: glycosyltransferase, partial [Candidatus Thermoplasmatota archaeon]|nr:glycosyltransferase [Candidatus Thermoplasmatota archaeon]